MNDGESTCLSCRIVCGNSAEAKKFDVIWLHNNKEIKPSKDFQYVKEGNIYKLQVAEVFPEDSGTFTCEAFNDAGECFSTCTVNVLVSGEENTQPKFKRFPKSASVQDGEPCEFVVEVEEELLTLEWYKDGRILDITQTRYKFEKSNSGTYSLKISKCSSTDVGQYQIKAVNKSNEAYVAFSLNVL